MEEELEEKNELTPDLLMDKISKVIEETLKRHDYVSLSIRDKDVTKEISAGRNGLLSVWVYQLDKIYKDMFGLENTGLYYYEDKQTACEVSPAYDEEVANRHGSALLLCANFTVEKYILDYHIKYEQDNHFKTRGPVKINIEDIYNDWYNAMVTGNVPLYNSHMSPSTPGVKNSGR